MENHYKVHAKARLIGTYFWKYDMMVKIECSFNALNQIVNRIEIVSCNCNTKIEMEKK